LPFLATPYFAIMAADFWLSPGDKDFNLGRLLFSVLDKFIYRQDKTEEPGFTDGHIYERIQTLEQIAFDCLLAPGSFTGTHRKMAGHYMNWYKLMEFVTSSAMRPYFVNKWIHAFFAAHFATRRENFSNDARRRFVAKNVKSLTPVKAAFVQLLQDLTGDDYSDLLSVDADIGQYFTEEERAWFSWGFEEKIARYYRDELGYDDVRSQYKPPYLGREIDVYAERKQGKRWDIDVVECKFRFPPYPKALSISELEQVHQTSKGVKQRRQQDLGDYGEQAKVNSVLITNAGGYAEEVLREAKSRRVKVYHVNMPANKFTARSRLTNNHIERKC